MSIFTRTHCPANPNLASITVSFDHIIMLPPSISWQCGPLPAWRGQKFESNRSIHGHGYEYHSRWFSRLIPFRVGDQLGWKSNLWQSNEHHNISYRLLLFGATETSYMFLLLLCVPMTPRRNRFDLLFINFSLFSKSRAIDFSFDRQRRIWCI